MIETELLPRQADITAAIKQMRSLYIESDEAPSYCEINNGLCDEFAHDFIDVMGGIVFDVLYAVGTDDFVAGEFWGDGVLDSKLLESSWGMSPPAGLEWEDLEKAGFSEVSHVWIVKDVRHYDAECPEGADSFFDLPIFKRYLLRYLRSNGIAADEVETEDVVPAPLCRIPNPVESGMSMG